jgi:2-dehydropantoate 2-reductase
MTEQAGRNYLIYGTGALGSIFGGLLQKSGCNVTFVGRGTHFKSMLEKGLRITGIWGEHYIPADQIKSKTLKYNGFPGNA